MTTMRDVARYAGVFVTAVSHVLHENPYVQEETRRRVLEAADGLHHLPNAVGGGLSAKKSARVGVVVVAILNPFFAALAPVVERDLSASGHRLIVCNTDEQPWKELCYPSLLVNKRGMASSSANPIGEFVCFAGSDL